MNRVAIRRTLRQGLLLTGYLQAIYRLLTGQGQACGRCCYIMACGKGGVERGYRHASTVQDGHN